MKFVALVLNLAFLSNIAIAQESEKSSLKEKTSEAQKRCVENPKACQPKSRKLTAKSEWCAKYPVPCNELKPIQAQAASAARRQAKKEWCNKHPQACAERQAIPQSRP